MNRSNTHSLSEADRSHLANLRAALREGALANDLLYEAVHEIADSRYSQAEPEVAQLLSHHDPEVRRIALQALTLHFHLQQYWPQAVDFLAHDTDLDCRVQGALSIMYLMQDTADANSLAILARVVKDQGEDRAVKRAAYRAMLGIIRFDPRQQMALASREFDPNADVDWALVDSYLGDKQPRERTE